MHTAKTNRYSIALTAALSILALAGCAPKKPAAAQAAPPEVSVVTARRSSIPVSMELPGRTSPYLVAQVRARVDGIVQKRSFQEGADVKANQALYQIDPAPYQAALNSARAAQQKAEANLAATSSQAERDKILIGGNAVSRQAYDNAVAAQGQAAADVAAAKAAVASASINLGYTKVSAPISGRSSISQVTQGAYVQGSAATLLTTVQQIDPIYVDLNQSSVAGLQLRRDVASGQLIPNGAGQVKVALTLEDGSQYPLSGVLQFNGVTVDPSTGSVTLRALFPNPKYVLLPGMFVHARIAQGVNDKAILIPIAGVSHNPQGQATALVVGPGNKVVQRTIQTQSTFDNQWVVTGGLGDGERIIVSGAQKVQPGMLVRASETPGQSSLPLEKLAANTVPTVQQAAMPASAVVAAK
ncbi:MAG: efflux RND transporter periplasmic adaptor subunit [Collimonas pratensis]|uniref:efflux RND transporter periplasmic adaptor subunit n=1 Tax=Collimonas pratensis TaxID=279113 RepID=UPI003C78B6C5